MLASFTIIPVGSGEELKEKVAEVIAIIRESGLSYTLGAMQTTVEGESSEVIDLIMKCHSHMRTLSSRVLTSITIDDREGAANRLYGKIEDVKSILGEGLCHE